MIRKISDVQQGCNDYNTVGNNGERHSWFCVRAELNLLGTLKWFKQDLVHLANIKRFL